MEVGKKLETQFPEVSGQLTSALLEALWNNKTKDGDREFVSSLGLVGCADSYFTSPAADYAHLDEDATCSKSLLSIHTQS